MEKDLSRIKHWIGSVISGIILTLFPIILIAISIFIFLFSHSKILYLISFLILIIGVMPITNLLLTYFYTKLKPKISNKKGNTAIIFAEAFTKFDIIDIYSAGVFFLIASLRQKRENYKIFYVNDRSSLREIILNENFNKLYIFGHGTVYGVGAEDGLFEYKSLKHKLNHKKLFVAQLHCNSNERIKSDDTSMAIFSKKYYITDNKMHLWDIWIYLFLTYLSGSIIFNGVNPNLGQMGRKRLKKVRQ